jgi:hypothetical protein
MRSVMSDVHVRLMAMARARDEIGPNAPERLWLSQRIVELIDELQALYKVIDADGPGTHDPPAHS